MAYHVAQDIREARTLPATYYRDVQALHHLRETVFLKAWHYVGFEQQCPQPGSLHPLVLMPGFLDEALFLSRNTDGQLFLLSNVCTHRGSILVREPCRAREVVCPYHGRRFSLDGSLLSMPLFQEAKNFPGATDNLARLPLERLGPLLFSSLASECSFRQVMGPLLDRMAWWPWEQLQPRPDLSVVYQVKAHWALYVENYLEGFHIPFVHKGLHSALDFGQYSVEILDHMVLQTAPARKAEEGFQELPSDERGQRPAAFYFWVFPHIMFNFYPWGLSLNVVVPQTIDFTLVYYYTFVNRPERLGQGAGAELHRVELEDQAIVEMVQKGIRSRLYQSGRYSPTMETGTHYFHRLLALYSQSKLNGDHT
ncbi:MAG: Rieske 2Fe-2S domain-containing protein [Flavobacteriales bacterium]|nr:Rieske 2Fe-2S domain-containing protein [Flavobacteriales bacterium]MCX7767662.1 Rieske 2Fe-2S domain-containing protein [Flavobacteriales bacterium]MDW8409496.1 SRPBCC family protein [Flavobacteriales bacterium]